MSGYDVTEEIAAAITGEDQADDVRKIDDDPEAPMTIEEIMNALDGYVADPDAFEQRLREAWAADERLAAAAKELNKTS